MTKSQKGIDSNRESDKTNDALDALREWLDKHLEHGRIKPEIFVKNHVAYRFTLKRGDEEASYEVQKRV